MTNDHLTKLTSSEASFLWVSYIKDSMSICIFQHFLTHIEDEEIKSLLSLSMSYSLEHVQEIQHTLELENIPVPDGFNEHDVKLNSPRLYTDPFYLRFLEQFGKNGLKSYSLALSNSYRDDVRGFFSKCINQTSNLFNQAVQLMLEKGMTILPLLSEAPEKVQYVIKQGFLAGWFGSKHSLTALEVAALHQNAQANAVGKALFTGFTQTAETKDARDYFKRGLEIAVKHIDIFHSILSQENLPFSDIKDNQVTASTTQIFSDKLAMYCIAVLNENGMRNYGTAFSLCQRRDLTNSFNRLALESSLYAEDGLHLQIKHNWVEHQPMPSSDGKSILP